MRMMIVRQYDQSETRRCLHAMMGWSWQGWDAGRESECTERDENWQMSV